MGVHMYIPPAKRDFVPKVDTEVQPSYDDVVGREDNKAVEKPVKKSTARRRSSKK